MAPLRDEGASQDLQARNTRDALMKLIQTAETHALAEDYEVKVSIGFMRELDALLEEALRTLREIRQFTYKTEDAGKIARAFLAKLENR